MRLFVKYLRHSGTIGLAPLPRSFMLRAHLNFLSATQSLVAQTRDITSPRGESLSARIYSCTRVILARNSWLLSGFLFVTMVTHVGRTQAWRAYRDVCDKVTFSLSLFLFFSLFFFFLSRRFSDPSSKLYVQLLRSDFLPIAFVATSCLRLELSLLTISTDLC